jgi:plastocyanin
MSGDTPCAIERFANRMVQRHVSPFMKRITGSLVVCVGAGVFTAGALLFGPGEDTSVPSVAPAPGASSTASPTLGISGFKFASITVKPGASVSIANRDDATHTVTADKGAFNTKASGKSTTSLRAPTKPGTYTFFCAIHPEMRGTLTVK